jgi:Tfp pilus assembly protein FimT
VIDFRQFVRPLANTGID